MRIKKTLHSFGQRVPKCTPNFRLSPKNFLRKFIPSLVPTGKHQFIGCLWKIFYLVKSLSLIWNYKSQWHPISQKKWENIFSVAGALFCFRQKVSSLIPTENSQMHTLNRKKILPIHLFGIEKSKRNLFFRKMAKKFARQYRRHTFDTKNIIGLLKYSERIHIGWIICQKVL